MPNGIENTSSQPPVIKRERSPEETLSAILLLSVPFILLLAIFLLNYFRVITLSDFSPALSFLPQRPEIVGKVADKNISKKDLFNEIKQVWGVYAEQEQPKSEVQESALKSITEKEIIRIEAQKLGVSVSEDEINVREQELIEQAGGREKYEAIIKGNYWTLEEQRQKINDQMLREKVEKKVVAWRIVDKVSGYRSPTLENYNELMEEVDINLQKVRSSMIEGKSARETLEEIKQASGIDPKIDLLENTKVRKDQEYIEEFREAIFNLHKGDITPVVKPNDGGTYMVAKIIDENDTPYESYEQWFDSVKIAYQN